MRLLPGICYGDFIGQKARVASFAPSMVEKEERGSVVEEEATTRGGAFEEFEAPGGYVLLACRGCAERVVLLGREDGWREEGRPTFACGGCGRVLTFADRVGAVPRRSSGPLRYESRHRGRT